MSLWRKISADKIEWTAFTVSFALHALIGVTLLFSKTMKMEEPESISIDMVTLHDSNPDSKESALVPQQTRRKEPIKKAISTRESSIAATDNQIRVDEVSKPDLAMGESDIESSLHGRAPINAAERYLADVRDQIARQQIYPAPSRSFREEGTVRIRLTLNRSGSVVRIELTQASTYKRLNDAAMRAATKASPFRPFPDEVKFEKWKITLPVRFTLTQN